MEAAVQRRAKAQLLSGHREPRLHQGAGPFAAGLNEYSRDALCACGSCRAQVLYLRPC